MEYLEGGSLAERLATNERFELSRVADWVDLLCGALCYVHENNVVHGGIKPTSIVFDKHDSPYLTDFAIDNSLVMKPTTC